MSNVDVKTVYRAERGDAPMRPETLLDIATALEVPLDRVRAASDSGADPGEADEQLEDEARGAGGEGHGNLLLRRVTRAARFHELARGRTAILISHRLSTVRMADRILVLANGRIVEAGAHDELIRVGGQYAELYEIQASKYR